MSDEKVHVEFTVPVGERERFLTWLQFMTDSKFENGAVIPPGEPLGYRADDTVSRRVALQSFADRMEIVLRRHDHKTTWRDRPIEALIQLMHLETEEFKVAYEFFEVSEIRKELIDKANYCMIVDDRLSLLDQDKTMREQTK